MGMKKYKPTSAAVRYMTTLDYSELSKVAPYKPLMEPYKSKGGRNNLGRLTSRFRGGGHKRLYRLIDFKRDKDNIPARIATIEYDPNRSARIALVNYADGEKRYILAPEGAKVGDVIISGQKADILPGHCLKLADIPIGTMVHNVEMYPGHGGQLGRSAGTAIQLMAKEGRHALIRMPSGELRKVMLECKATVGQIGNLDHVNVIVGKAGRKRWLGRKPHNRGVCMNPVDHPNGGGEAKGKGGHPRSPWGQYAKGGKTRKNKRTNKNIIRRRSNKAL